MLDPLSSPARKSPFLLRVSEELHYTSTIHWCKLYSSIITKIVWPQRLPCRVLGILWHPPSSWHILRIIHSAMAVLTLKHKEYQDIHDPGHVLGLPCQNSACPSTIGPLLFSHMGIRPKVFPSRDDVQWAMQLCCVKNPQACYTVYPHGTQPLEVEAWGPIMNPRSTRDTQDHVKQNK